MNTNIETEFLTAEDAAKLLGISKQTFHRLHSTRLPSINISKDKKYPKGELLKYLNSLIQPAARPLEANI
jgi:predicted DNA-binding transcriptional regulator AlpA